MSDQNITDPLKMWKQLYDVNEKYWGKMMNDVVQKEEFSEWMGTVLDFNLYCKKVMNDQSKTFLEASNIASKEDIANVASLVINLEQKVDTIDDHLFDQAGNELDTSALKKDMTKLKSETKAIHQQINELKTSLTSIEKLLQQLTTNK
ncbi:DUF2730 family protein [Bacillus sp. OAE603]|uniref:DUF2730 family protein n=1 Tax=Gottfriedia sp. OAE603 TaxID=2663872 RepID=UPI00178BC56F